MLANSATPRILSAAEPADAPATRTRVFIGSHGDNGILAYDWESATGTLTATGVATKIPKVAWLAFSHGHDFLYSASELDLFEGKPTGEVASFRFVEGELQPLSARNSAGTGNLHM